MFIPLDISHRLFLYTRIKIKEIFQFHLEFAKDIEIQLVAPSKGLGIKRLLN